MNEPRWLSEAEARAWRGFQTMSSRLEAELHRSLFHATGLSISDYKVLVHLTEAPEGALRAFELGAVLQWEKSRLSHHLRRMESRGLVERRVCETDGRGVWATITRKGRSAIEAAAPHHVEDARRLLIDQLSAAQVEALAEISEKVLAGLPTAAPSCDD